MRRTPIHIHVGCGKLGIGAVIPFLHANFPDRTVVLVQRRAPHWVDLDDGATCHLENDRGFYRAYRTHTIGSASEVARACANIGKGAPSDHLLLVPSLGVLDVILRKIGGHSLTVSCALGNGQADLALPLRASTGKWSRLYAFENTLHRTLDGLRRDSLVHHVVVDRICWDAGQTVATGSGERNGIRIAHCEQFAAYWIPANADLSSAEVKKRGDEFGLPSKTTEVHQYKAGELDAIVMRKRALVNATHTVLTILCFHALQGRGMSARDQYLAAVVALTSRELPEALCALDVYMRLRAAEVATNEVVKLDGERWHAVFGECMAMARKAMRRFLATPDRLSRVFSGAGLKQDLLKKNEHIDRPLESFFMHSHSDAWAQWRLGRPSEEDVVRVRAYLETAFQSALLLSRELTADLIKG